MNQQHSIRGYAPPTLRLAGDRAVLLDFGSLEAALHGFRALESAFDRGLLEVDDLIPAAETVLARGGDARRPGAFYGLALAAIQEEVGVDHGNSLAPEIIVPIVYDGQDLAEVASLTGFSETEVIRRHAAADYLVAFTGFAPGFAYLAGGDPGLVVPRRATPRHRIPEGAVGLADRFTGIYPRESPGGWQLLGHTSLLMWDLTREPPALLKPGGAVRFEAVREHITASQQAASVPLLSEQSDLSTQQQGRANDFDDAVDALEILEPGLQTVFQDFGRPRQAQLGVSVSGAADHSALREGNELVGNNRDATALELGAGPFAGRILTNTVIALTGAPRPGTIVGPLGTRDMPHAQAVRVDAGETLHLRTPTRGVRTMLSIRGGMAAPIVLGSMSRDTLAGLGPEPLQIGDRIRVAPPSQRAVGFATVNAKDLPAPGDETELRIILGPRDHWFDAAGLETLCATRWEVSPRSDRVGVRLVGGNVRRAPEFRDCELPSEGLTNGAIQVPPDGQPVLFLADHPLTGGYPVIGIVCESDLDRAAQLPPGSYIRFAVAAPANGHNVVVDSNEGVTP